MGQNFSYKNISPDFIRGTTVEFSELEKVNGSYITAYRDTIDDFLNDDITLIKVKEAGVTHLFLHVLFYVDEHRGVVVKDGVKYYNHLTLKNHNEQNNSDVINDDKWEEKLLKKWEMVIDKIVAAGLIPIIKIMNDHYDQNDAHKLDNAEIFFEDYLNLTKKILDADKNCNVELITIANETGLIRKYLGLRSYWKEYIDKLRQYRINRGREIKISMSQFFQDIASGICDICDLVDIIGFNYYPAIPDLEVPALSDVIKNIYNNYLYVIQQYCKSINKKFIITEYGCTCWEGQTAEPAQGNSMALYYKKLRNYFVQATYLQGACIVTPMIDMCIGINIAGINKGSNYNWVYKCAIDINKAQENPIVYNAVKIIWGNVDNIDFDRKNKLWISTNE